MMKLRAPLKLGIIIGLMFFANQAMAQGSVLPSSVLPEKVSQGITQQQPAQVSQGGAPIAPPKPAPSSALGPEAEKIKFKLTKIILVGNHVYSEQQLLPIYKNKLGKTISIVELINIVQAITNYYRNNGYIITRAILPPQHVKNGVVKVQIIEGYIGNVTVSGEPKGAKCIVQAYGYRIKACPPLQIKRMERYLLIANETPATTVKAVLSPSKNLPGAADLTLVTVNKPATAYVSYDNYGTRYIGPQQMTGNVSFNSWLASGDQFQTTVTRTPKGKQLRYIDLNYGLPLFDEGVRFLIGGTRVFTHPGFVLAKTDINGINNNYYTNVMYPIIRSRTETLSARTGFNWVDTNVTTFNQLLYHDHLRSLDFGATYNFSDKFYGANLISGDYRQGLPIFNYTDNFKPTAETSRPGGHAVYSKITLTGSRLQAIKGPLSAYILATGQYAFQPLLASEQFAYGGSQLGRGYDVAEILGDRGLAGSAELRYDLALPILNKIYIQTLQFYIFYDAGVTWNIIKVLSVPNKQSATSTGFGVRFFATKYISGNFMWTQPLTKKVAAEALAGRAKNSRVFFSVVATFM